MGTGGNSAYQIVSTGLSLCQDCGKVVEGYTDGIVTISPGQAVMLHRHWCPRKGRGPTLAMRYALWRHRRRMSSSGRITP